VSVLVNLLLFELTHIGLYCHLLQHLHAHLVTLIQGCSLDMHVSAKSWIVLSWRWGGWGGSGSV